MTVESLDVIKRHKSEHLARTGSLYDEGVSTEGYVRRSSDHANSVRIFLRLERPYWVSDREEGRWIPRETSWAGWKFLRSPNTVST